VVRAPALLALAVVLAAGRAAAGPTDDPAAGHAVFTGAVSPHPSSLIGNIAAMSMGPQGLHLWLGGVISLDQYWITPRAVDPASGAQTDLPPLRSSTWSPGGTFAIYGVHNAFTLGATIDLPPAERYIAGRQALRYQTLGGQHRENTWVAVGGALRLVGGFYVGGSASYVESTTDLEFARDTALEAGQAGIDADCGGAPCGLGNPLADEVYQLHVSTGPTKAQTKIAFTMGIAWRITDRIIVGAVYHEPQGFNASLSSSGTAEVTRAVIAGGGTVTGDAVIGHVPPQTLEVGARIRSWPRLDTVLGARWLNLSRYQEYDVRMFGRELTGIPPWYPRPRGYRDVIEAWGGVEQVDDGQPLIGGVRLGLQSGAVSHDKISAMQVEGWSATADVGLQWRIRPGLVLEGDYGAQYYPQQDVTQSAYDPLARLACVASGYDYSTAACQTVRDGYGTDTAAGVYRRLEHVFHLGLRYDFQ
jgi:long-subunit fatty acid transport protein